MHEARPSLQLDDHPAKFAILPFEVDVGLGGVPDRHVNPPPDYRAPVLGGRRLSDTPPATCSARAGDRRPALLLCGQHVFALVAPRRGPRTVLLTAPRPRPCH